MAISSIVQCHLNELRQHVHVDEIVEIKPFVYKVMYWPRSLESVYAQIPYTLKLSLPETYPDKPPFITFLDPIHHLNIHPATGQLSMSILSQDWSPFLNLKAIINSLDQILQQPDETHPASVELLQEYQNDITAYVGSVRAVLEKRMNNKDQGGYGDNSRQQYQQQLYSQEEQVQSVIQVDDFSQYKINNYNHNDLKLPNVIQPSLSAPKSIHLLDIQRKDDSVKQHNYSFNKEDEGDGKKQLGGRVEERDVGRQLVRQEGERGVGEQGKQLPQRSDMNNKNKGKNPAVISFTNNNNNNNIQQSPQPKFKTSLHPLQPSTRKLPLQQDKHHLSYESLKQNMVRCKQLITIFSAELDEMQKSIEQSKSKRIKKVLQQKCGKLEQMIVELFEINQKNKNKLMEFVRDGCRQGL